MNKNYRVIWNRALGNYVVTSELAHGKSKSSTTSNAVPRQSFVCTAIATALLMVSPITAIAAGVEAGAGQNLDLNGNTITTSAAGAYGVLAKSGGLINGTNLSVMTSGSKGYAVYATGLDSLITLNDGNITATGVDGHGLVAGNHATINADNVDIKSNGHGAYANAATLALNSAEIQVGNANADRFGIYAVAGSKVNVDSVNIATSNNRGYGVYATDAGTQLDITNSKITNSGADGHGLVAGNKALLSAENVDVTSAGHGAYVNNANMVLNNVNIVSGNTGAERYGIYAINGGAVNASNVNVETSGNKAYGVFSDDEGSNISIKGGSVTTTGVDGHALVAEHKATLNAADMNIISTGHGAYANDATMSLNNVDINAVGSTDARYGILAVNKSNVIASNVNVTTKANQAYGIYAADADSKLSINGGSISTTGKESHGLVAGKNASVTANNVVIKATGYGVYANNASITGNNLDITANEHDAVLATGANASINLSGGSVSATGDSARGIVAGDKATINIENVTINTTGKAIHTNKSNAIIENVNIQSGSGISAQAGANNIINNANIIVTGTNNYDDSLSSGKGISVLDGSQTSITNSNIVLAGKNNTAFLSGYFGENKLDIKNSSVNGSNGGVVLRLGAGKNNVTASHILANISDKNGKDQIIRGVDFDDGYTTSVDNLKLTDSLINLLGSNAVGIYGYKAISTANLKDTQIHVTDGIGVKAITAAALTVNLDHSQLNSKTLLQSGYVASTDNTTAVRKAIINAENQSVLTGNVDIDRSQTTDSQINLDSASIWSGASKGLHSMSLKTGSQWNITGDSNVDALKADNSTINFDHTNGGFETLTVNGNYVSNNSTLKMNAKLGDDNSGSDKFHVTGDAKGTTYVAITNAGGLGAKTLQGIDVIRVDGDASGAEFKQSGRIVAGAYDYTLTKVGDNHGWELNSELAGSGNGGGVNPIKPEHMTVRPEAGSYIANQSAANSLFSTSMNDRAGETRYIDAQGNVQSTNLWLRNIAGHNRFNDSTGQLKTNGNRYGIQLGGDLAQGGFGVNDAFRFGAMAGYGNVQSNTVSKVTGYSSKAQLHGYSAGLYGTWMQNAAEQSGVYVDSWALYNIFDNSVKGDDIGEQSYKSKGITASVETGYSAKVANVSENYGFWLRPQAQLTWQGVKAAQVKERNGTSVNASGEDNLQSRLGVRAYFKGNPAAADRSSIEPYVEANWLHNTKAVGATLNNVNISEAGARNVGEVKVGVDAKLNQTVSLWANVAQQVGNHSYSDTSAIAGVKVSF